MKVIIQRSKCIGCGSCAAICPEFFEMVEDGFSHLKNSKRNNEGNDELEISELNCIKEAADVCPVQIIKIE